MLKDEGFVLDYQVGTYAADEQGHTTFNPSGNFGGLRPIYLAITAQEYNHCDTAELRIRV